MMLGWRGGYWLPTEAAERPGVSARTVERLVAASRQSVQPGMARGWSGGEDRRDVPDDAFRRHVTAIVRSVPAAVALLGQPSRQARISVANMRVVFTYRLRRLVVDVGCGTTQRPKTKESSYGTFDEHG